MIPNDLENNINVLLGEQNQKLEQKKDILANIIMCPNDLENNSNEMSGEKDQQRKPKKYELQSSIVSDNDLENNISEMSVEKDQQQKQKQDELSTIIMSANGMENNSNEMSGEKDKQQELIKEKLPSIIMSTNDLEKNSNEMSGEKDEQQKQKTFKLLSMQRLVTLQFIKSPIQRLESHQSVKLILKRLDSLQSVINCLDASWNFNTSVVYIAAGAIQNTGDCPLIPNLCIFLIAYGSVNLLMTIVKHWFATNIPVNRKEIRQERLQLNLDENFEGDGKIKPQYPRLKKCVDFLQCVSLGLLIWGTSLMYPNIGHYLDDPNNPETTCSAYIFVTALFAVAMFWSFILFICCFILLALCIGFFLCLCCKEEADEINVTCSCEN